MIDNTTSRGAGIVARRSVFLVSAAAVAFASAGAAQAQDVGGLAPVLEAQAGVSTADLAPVLQAQDAHVNVVAPDPQIVIADPGTPTTARDPAGVNGIGQMIVDEQNGFIGLCTASLINPRTVIFAAHCVNELPANAYGASSDGYAIGFGFSDNNNERGNSAFGDWLNNGYLTSTGQYMYNSNYVAYNARSTEAASGGPGGFLYADVAMAALDTPAAGIPTWALLFSPLPAQNQGADGTGYHVAITGYGNNGTGSTGSTGGIDFRRRSADNMLGALASLNDFEGFLFGADDGLPQNLYWIDFDDPARGTATASPYDFNAWRDNAVANEGITASGDSGGPLILDEQYQMKVIIGTLSGGYTRFFNGQPANGYGTASFYQPTYLYWDWVAQNNPYHYVSAKAGDGNWNDPNHWVTNLDPAYMVLDANGNLVNGIPTTPGGTDVDTSGKFGEACFQTTGVSDCYDVATGTETVTGNPIGTAANDAGTASVAALTNDAGHVSSASLTSQAATAGSQTTQALPSATLANGLPGASGFVPNDYDGDAAHRIAPRYFDVTLSATGTTSLGNTVTVDRFAITGAGAALDIKGGGSLTSLIDINQYQGMMRVNGTLSTPGDYMLMFGGLQGSGNIYTPYFTNVAGVIAPGGIGTIGTLTFHGNAILSSGSTYLVDIGNNRISDRIAVAATAFDADNVPLDGMASIGGNVLFGSTHGAMVRDGNTYTILTAEGGLEGTFNAPQSISAILKPTLSYTPTSVAVTIKAGTYASVVDAGSPVQVAYARLLDANRAGYYSTFAGLYGPLDLQDQATIQATLQGLAPRVQTLSTELGMAAVDAIGEFNRERIAHYDPNATGGTVAMLGNPLQMAARGATPVQASGSEGLVSDSSLPDNINVFLAGGYINGDAAPMTGYSGRSQFDGWFGAAGLELNLGGGMLGFEGSYSDLNGNVAGAAQGAENELYQGAIYGKFALPQAVVFDMLISFGEMQTDTVRAASFLGSNYTLESHDNATVLSGEAGISKAFGAGTALTITPRASLRANEIAFGTQVEHGGPFALASQIGTFRNLQARGGVTLELTRGAIQPYVSATYVHDFEHNPAVFEANFVGGANAPAAFALTGTDQDWGEIAGGLTFRTGNIDLGLAAHTNVGRKEESLQSYRGSVTIHF